jgi:putative peptidoglycan lipid II flippase
VTVSGAVQCLWLAVSCYRARATILLLRPHLSEASKKLFHRIGPGAVGAGAAQINLLISTILASTLPTGAVSYLFYADRLNQLPLGIVGIAVATTLLPLLSRHIEAGAEDKVRHYNSRAIEFCLILGLPATIGLSFVAEPIIQTLFQHGAFTHEDTTATANALCAYALGIPGFLLVKVFAAGFFARHDTKTPVKIAILAMTANVCVSIILLGLLQYIGIALANSIAVTINAALLYRQLRRKHFPIGDEKLPLRIKKTILCAFFMSVVTFALTHFVWNQTIFTHISQEILYLFGLILISILSYAAALHVTKTLRWQDVVAMGKNFDRK